MKYEEKLTMLTDRDGWGPKMGLKITDEEILSQLSEYYSYYILPNVGYAVVNEGGDGIEETYFTLKAMLEGYSRKDDLIELLEDGHLFFSLEDYVDHEVSVWLKDFGVDTASYNSDRIRPFIEKLNDEIVTYIKEIVNK